MSKLLTVAVPTYNRAAYLDTNLGQLCRQVQGLADTVELLVSDNCSSDHTGEVVRKYQARGYDIKYQRNEENIGADRNFIQCFDLAQGQYLLILGDDDLLVDGALHRIVNFLKTGRYGIVRLYSYGYDRDFKEELPKRCDDGPLSSDAQTILRQVSYFIGYVSGFIVNKELLETQSGFLSDRFDGSNFPHVYWFITAAIRADQNGVVHGYSVAAKRNNSGNYKLFEVFSIQLNRVFDWFVAEEGLPVSLFQRINNHMLLTFYPYFILRTRSGLNSSFDTRNAFRTLYNAYRFNFRFWLFNAPLFVLPRWFCQFIYRVGDALIKP